MLASVLGQDLAVAYPPQEAALLLVCFNIIELHPYSILLCRSADAQAQQQQQQQQQQPPDVIEVLDDAAPTHHHAPADEPADPKQQRNKRRRL
jgi:hypothetical protein